MPPTEYCVSDVYAVLVYYEIRCNIAGHLGVSVWVLFALLLAAVAFGVYSTWLKRPKIAMATLPPIHKGVRHWLFEKRYHPFAAAVIIGVIAIFAWVTSTSTGRVGGLGITTPSADIVNFLVTGSRDYPVTHFAQTGEASWEIVVQKA